MKVVDTRNGHWRPFDDLEIGTTFMYNTVIYMKTNIMKYPAGRIINAIALESGNDVCFGDGELVTPVKCELHIVD